MKTNRLISRTSMWRTNQISTGVKKSMNEDKMDMLCLLRGILRGSRTGRSAINRKTGG